MNDEDERIPHTIHASEYMKEKLKMMTKNKAIAYWRKQHSKAMDKNAELQSELSALREALGVAKTFLRVHKGTVAILKQIEALQQKGGG